MAQRYGISAYLLRGAVKVMIPGGTEAQPRAGFFMRAHAHHI